MEQEYKELIEKAVLDFDNNVSDVLEQFEFLAENFPSAITYNNLAYYYFYEEENIERAEKAISKALEFKPSHSFPYAIFGDILMYQNKYKEAIREYQKALEFYENSTICHSSALAYFLTGNTEKAAEFFEKAVRDSNNTNSNKQHSLYCLFVVLIKMGLKKNLEYLIYKEEFLLVDDDVLSGQVFFYLSDYKKACEYFARAYEDYVLEFEWIKFYLFSLSQINDFSKIAEIINRAISKKKAVIKEFENEIKDIEKLENPDLEDVDDYEYAKSEISRETEEIKKFNKLNLRNFSKSTLNLSLDSKSNILYSCYLFGCMRHRNIIPEKI